MGIKNFSQFLKRYAPNTVDEVPLSYFSGESIAIDLPMVVHECMYGASISVLDSTNLALNEPKEEDVIRDTVSRVLKRLNLLWRHGITPVCITDGKTHPLKMNTRQSRIDKKKFCRDKLDAAADALYGVDPLLRTDNLISDYRKAYKSASTPTSKLYDALEQAIPIRGIELLHAEDYELETTDAEGVCALLCRQGICCATFTSDSDYHVYGGETALTKIVYREGGVYVTRRSLTRILENSALTFEQFRDLCIMMGTDFNSNMPRVGVVGSWKYIQKHGCVRNIPIDTSILNYDNVLRIFDITSDIASQSDQTMIESRVINAMA